MRRTALAVAVVIAVIAVVVLAIRGRGGASDTAGSRDSNGVVAVGTAARAALRARRAESAAADAKSVEHRIDGVVVDAQSDEPICGAEILVARRRTPEPREGFLDTELPGEPEFRATTPADGKFVVDVTANGPWFVTARAPDHVDAAKLVRVGDTVRFELAVGVEKTFTVRRFMDRAPIAGAEISVYGWEAKGPAPLHRVTDEHGEARLRVGSDLDTLVVRAKGYARDCGSAQFTEIVLWPSCRIDGVVRDRAGHGVAGAVLRRMDLSDDPRTWTSDAEGRFVLDEVCPEFARNGKCGVEVKADSFETWNGGLLCNETAAVVELSRMGVVTGTVLLPDGSPAVNAHVGESTTDADGAFRVAVGPGRNRLRARCMAPGGSVSEELIGSTECEVPDGGAVSDVVIRLMSKSTVTLRVVDGSGKPVTEVHADEVAREDREVRGDLVVLRVEEPVGTQMELRLAASQAGGPRWRVKVRATTQASADGTVVDVRLPALREFTATVLAADGSPLPSAVRPKVTLHEESLGSDVAPVRADVAAATWLVDPAKRHTLEVSAEGFADVRRQVTPDEIATGRLPVRLEAGVTIRGRVVSSDPRAVADAKFLLASADPRSRGLFSKDIAYAADGSFRVDQVSSGPWLLTIRPSPSILNVVDREIHVAGDADVDLGDIVVPASTWLRGIVRTPDGRPCGGAVVQFTLRADENRFAPSIVSGADGSFATYVPAVGHGALLVRRRGFGAAVVRVEGVDLATPLIVALAPEGRLDVRARLQPDVFGLHVQTPDGAVRWDPYSERMDDKLGFDYRETLSGLPAGPIVVVLEVGEQRFTGNATVVAGETLPVVVGPER